MKIFRGLPVSTKQIFVFVAAVVSSVLLTWLIVSKISDSSKRDLSSVVNSVKEHMILPDEEPTLAIVENTDQLQDKTLKAIAKNGDELLLYTNAGLVIVYRPSADKIVAVRPVTVDAAQAQANGATIKILNGTDNADVTEQLSKEVSKKYPTAKVTVGKANRNTYEKTIVIDNGSTKDDIFVQLIELTKGQRGVTPLGEQSPKVDIVILIGKDYLERVKL